MQPDFSSATGALWIGVGIVWAVTAVRTKRTERVQSLGSRLIHLLLAVAGFTLLFKQGFGFGVLGRQVVPDSAAIAYTGLALTVAGLAFAIWARLLLGGNWSALVTIKRDHRIVRRGPYRVVRHPIYSGGLLAVLGTALVVGELRGLIALALIFTAWWLKLRLEEEFLEKQFGEEYVEYRRKVKALIPFVL